MRHILLSNLGFSFFFFFESKLSLLNEKEIQTMQIVVSKKMSKNVKPPPFPICDHRDHVSWEITMEIKLQKTATYWISLAINHNKKIICESILMGPSESLILFSQILKCLCLSKSFECLKYFWFSHEELWNCHFSSHCMKRFKKQFVSEKSNIRLIISFKSCTNMRRCNKQRNEMWHHEIQIGTMCDILRSGCSGWIFKTFTVSNRTRTCLLIGKGEWVSGCGGE